MLGEGLHMEFWRRRSTKDDPDRAKLELYAILRDQAAWQRLEQACESRILELQKRYYKAIDALPSSRQEPYNRVKRLAKVPTPEKLVLQDEIVLHKDERRWDKHLYLDKAGEFRWDANSWEEPLLSEELARRDVVGWLRVVPRREWALAIPHERNGVYKTLYPDLLVVRKVEGRLVVDILDPHNPSLSDAVDKAVGLAKYAEKHGDAFARIELVRVEGNSVLRLPLHEPDVRGKAARITTDGQLEALFNELGVCEVSVLGVDATKSRRRTSKTTD